MIALPVTFLVLAMVVLMAWLAARAQSRGEKLAALQRDYQTSQQTLLDAQKQTISVQSDLALARDPGRTTVVLQPPVVAAKKVRHGAKAEALPAPTAWAAAVWGENQGKSWIRLDAYGLNPPPQDQAIEVWFEPAQGAPIAVGRLDPSANGIATLEGKSLPGVDQGKRLFASMEQAGAMEPAGPVLFTANLPNLVPMTRPAPDATSPAGAAPAGAPPAKQGEGAPPAQ